MDKYAVIETAKGLKVVRNTPNNDKEAKYKGDYNDCLKFVASGGKKEVKTTPKKKATTAKKSTSKSKATKGGK